MKIIEIPEHMQRMIEEYNELCDKVNKLQAFIDDVNDGFIDLEEDEQIDIKSQLNNMIEYYGCLRRRLTRAGVDIPNC